MNVIVGVSEEAVPVSDGTVTVVVIYSVDAETVIVVSGSVGNKLVWSPPGVLPDEAGMLHPWDRVPVPQLELTLEPLPYGGADGTLERAVELGVPIGKLISLPSVAVLLGVSSVLVTTDTGGAVAVTVTVTTT